MTIIYPNGTARFDVASGSAITVVARDGAQIYQRVNHPNQPDSEQLLYEIVGDGAYTVPALSESAQIRVEAGPSGAEYDVGVTPQVRMPFADMFRSTVTNGATLTAVQHSGSIIYMDASGGNVAFATLTAAELITAFPQLSVGGAMPLYVASNHPTNLATVSPGTGVTVVGYASATQTGATFQLVRTAAAAFDLNRVG